MTHVGVVGFDLDFQILDRFDRGHNRGTIRELGDRHAFEQVAVAAARPPAQRQKRRIRLVLIADELRVARLDHVRGGDRQVEGVAPEDRQAFEHLRVQGRRHRRVRTLDERRLPGDRNLFFDRAHLQREVLDDELLRADAKPLPFFRLEPRNRDLQRVGGGENVREGVFPDIIGHGRARGVCLLVDEDDFCARNDTLRIADLAADATLIRLTGGGRHAHH